MSIKRASYDKSVMSLNYFFVPLHRKTGINPS